MTWNTTTRGNSEHCYLQVGFGFGTVWEMGVKEPDMYSRNGNVGDLRVKCCMFKSSDRKLFCFKPIPNLNPYLNQ